MLAVRALLLAVFAVVVCGLALDSARAQEPAAAEGTTLRPGVNLVGWVGEPTSVSQLFRDIPQLEAIWAWDTELDDWIVAGRNAPEWLGGLGRVSAGMGLRLVLGGEESFLWQRSTEPTRGLVELSTGWNLVAWSGADGAPLDQVAKGIGWSLRELRRWDAANQRWEVWTSPERSAQLIATGAAEQAGPVTVRRGEGLWINVARAVNWLQPTDILPRLVFPGGASDELQARVREDLEAVLAFYGQQYGIQAPPDFTVYIPKDVEALIQTFKDDSYEIDGVEAASIRALWNKAEGWAGRGIGVKQVLWPEDLSTSEIAYGRYVLSHEYFHRLQAQLSDGSVNKWLVEGTATWATDEHQVLDGKQLLQVLREQWQSKLSSGTPTLRSTEYGNVDWEYGLGWLAIDRLTTAAGSGSYIEFWRRLAATAIGPHGRWTSTPDWRTAFQETFGVSVSSFYADFNAWQRERVAVNGPAASFSVGPPHWIRGRITDESGAPVTGALVVASWVEGEQSLGWDQGSETDTDGAFAISVLHDRDYLLSLTFGSGCTVYYRTGGLTIRQADASRINVTETDSPNLQLRVPEGMCVHQITGNITTTDDQPLAYIRIEACREVDDRCMGGFAEGRTDADGSFAITVPVDGRYRVYVAFDDCTVYFRAGSFTTFPSERSAVRVAGRDARLTPRSIPAEMCAYHIAGQFSDASGASLAVKQINYHTTDCLGAYPGGWTDTNGRFDIRVPSDGAYYFSLLLWYGESYCVHVFEGQALGSRDNPVRVSDSDVTGVELRLPGTIEELCG